MHLEPPLTPAAVLFRHRWTVPVLAGVFLTLAVLASVDGGEVLLTWDEPVQRATESARQPWLDTAVGAISRLGGWVVVSLGLGVLLLLVFRKCPSLAMVLLAASLARPPLEWTLKILVGRERPDFERLVPGHGPSFPSGHVMASIALWGLLPPVIALVTGRRRWWWWSVVFAGAVIGLVAASRVYLGVHWLSDVVGGLVLGSLYLAGVEWLLSWHHRRRPCPLMGTGPPCP